jgi:hypothetical protein
MMAGDPSFDHSSVSEQDDPDDKEPPTTGPAPSTSSRRYPVRYREVKRANDNRMSESDDGGDDPDDSDKASLGLTDHRINSLTRKVLTGEWRPEGDEETQDWIREGHRGDQGEDARVQASLGFCDYNRRLLAVY